MGTYDVIVLGLGGVGSAACATLAARGARVLGIEQMTPAHSFGSSHGEVRLIRASYLDRPTYAPLLQRSYALWDDLSRAAGEPLITRAGIVVLASAERGLLRGEALAERALACGARVEPLEEADVRRRLPWLRLPEGYHGYFEPGGGFVAAERSILAQLRLAEARGAELRFEEPVRSWSSSGTGVAVTTAGGTHAAGALVVAAGAWSGRLLAELGAVLTVRRLAQMWFPSLAGRGPAAPACFMIDTPRGLFFGFPEARGEVKVAGGGLRDVIPDPSHLDRRLHPEDIAPVRRFVAECLPGLASEPSRGSVCMCTMTTDEDFLVDVHPEYPNVAFAAGLSGHGFKLAPALGEILADLATGRESALPFDFLRLRR